MVDVPADFIPLKILYWILRRAVLTTGEAYQNSSLTKSISWIVWPILPTIQPLFNLSKCFLVILCFPPVQCLGNNTLNDQVSHLYQYMLSLYQQNGRHRLISPLWTHPCCRLWPITIPTRQWHGYHACKAQIGSTSATKQTPPIPLRAAQHPLPTYRSISSGV